jgi:CubicO group peptidase (beta-lactamase class C family)
VTLADALSQVGDWPVPTVAAAVVGPDGVLAAKGATSEPFPLASVTKPLAVLTMLVAVEEGALELSAPADEALIPGATLRHLMSHASGLAPERPLRSFAPAVRRVYSNVGIELAASLVETAGAMPFASYFDEALVHPLDLSATSLAGSPASAGAASVDDLARVMQEVLSPPSSSQRFLHPSTLEDAISVQFPGLRGVLPGFGGQDPNDWGLGFEIRGNKHPHWTGSANSPATFGHFGQCGTMFWIDPVARVGAVALTDRAFDKWAAEAWPKLSDAVLEQHANTL